MISTPCTNCGSTPSELPSPPVIPPIPPLPTSSPLLLTNDPPVDSDVPYIRGFLSNANDRLDDLSKRLLALTSAMDVLVQERDALLADVRSHTAILSPLRNLPCEILCRIFVLAVPPLRRLELPRAPWFLGHICQRWRDISVALPTLWSAFGIDKKISCPSGAFETQFSRAGQANLQITIISASTPPLPPLDTLIVACDRWDTLAVKDATVILPIIGDIKGKLPSLRQFYADHISPLAVEILESCRYLCDVRTAHKGLDPSVNIPWHNLTRYSGLVGWDSYLDILRKTPNLVECHLDFTTFLGPNSASSDIVLLPHLVRLFVVGIPQCLEHITAPRLEELALDLIDTEYDPEHVQSFIRRSSCTIIRLSCFRCRTMSPLLPILQEMPSIVELTVEFVDGTDAGTSFVEEMTPKGRFTPAASESHCHLLGRHGAQKIPHTLVSQDV